MRKWLYLSAVVIVFDQVSKIIAETMLMLHTPIAVMPHVNLTLVYNPGAAFSFLSQAGGWQRGVLLGISVVICLFLYHWLKRLEREEVGSAVSIALIIGGALGNAIDRLIHGQVIDFIDVYYNEYHWPVFNLADAAITMGALILIVVAIRSS